MLIAFLSLDVLGASHLHSLFEILLDELFLGRLERVTPEVLHSEAHTAQLNGVKLLNLVVIFTVSIFERPCNQP